MNRLENKIAIITGVANPNSIGFGIAKRLAEEGANVLLFDIQNIVKDRAKDLREMGYKSQGFICDLTDSEIVTSCVMKIIEDYNYIHILVNNAGKSAPPRPKFLDMSEKYFDKIMDRNFRTNFITSKAIVPQMVKNNYGKIINISSISGTKVAYRYSAAYAASKGAVSAFTRALALELGEHNITVNAVLPGHIDIEKPFWTKENDKFNFKRVHPMMRWPINGPGFPVDIANAVLFLATDESRYITAQELIVDGGATIVEPAPSPDDMDIYTNE